MKTYQNVMEDIVEQEFDHMKSLLKCCDCEHCRNDIVAYALNQLPPRYVVSHSGNLISKADSLRTQKMTDIQAAIIRGSQIVSQHPRH